MERRTIDLTQKPDDDQSFIEQMQEFRKIQDESRKISEINVDKIRKDIMTVAKWATLPDQQRLMRLYWTVAQRKITNKKTPDLAIDCPALWNAALGKFSDLCERYPSLIKMAITEGHMPAFKTDLDMLLQHIASVQNGVTSVSGCTNSFEGHLTRKYYRPNDN